MRYTRGRASLLCFYRWDLVAFLACVHGTSSALYTPLDDAVTWHSVVQAFQGWLGKWTLLPITRRALLCRGCSRERKCLRCSSAVMTICWPGRPPLPVGRWSADLWSLESNLRPRWSCKMYRVCNRMPRYAMGVQRELLLTLRCLLDLVVGFRQIYLWWRGMQNVFADWCHRGSVSVELRRSSFSVLMPASSVWLRSSRMARAPCMTFGKTGFASCLNLISNSKSLRQPIALARTVLGIPCTTAGRLASVTSGEARVTACRLLGHHRQCRRWLLAPASARRHQCPKIL